MAENIRSYEEILYELFFGKNAALEKFAKVQHALYEILLWWKYGLPLSQIDSSAKAYFSKRFLGGKRIDRASDDEIKKAIEALTYAAGGLEDEFPFIQTGCRQRCHSLVNELNEALKENGFDEVDVEKFLKYFTFHFYVVLDEYDKPMLEPGYDFQIRHFDSDQNRLWFKTILRVLFILKLRLSMLRVHEIVKYLRKYAKPAPKQAKSEE